MKQAANSLLTLCHIIMTAMSSVPEIPRAKAGTNDRHRTPFNVYWKNMEHYRSMLPGLSCSPRSFVRSWLGEERIRSLFQGIGIVFIVAGTAVCSIRTASGADNLVVSVKEEAWVQSATILLKDVADLRGPNADALETLSRIPLGPAPEFGSVKTLSRRQIGQCIQAAAGPLRSEELSGAAAVRVHMKGRAVNPEEIASLFKAHIRKTSRWDESEIEIRSIGNGKGIELPPDGAELRISPVNALWGPKSIMIPVEIARQGKTLRSFWITAEIAIRAEVLVAAQKITPGKIVTPDDFLKKTIPIPDLHAMYARNSEEVVGKTAGRTISPGDPLLCEFFTSPLLVKSGETVQLRLERDGIVVISQGRAEQDGKRDQIIRVRNVDFLSVVKARVTGRSQVMVQ
jgi:flagella basal body P-ring formation protein FlgA